MHGDVMTSTETAASVPAQEQRPQNEALHLWSFGAYVEKKRHEDKEFDAENASDLAIEALEFMLDEIEHALGERTIGESSTPFRSARASTAHTATLAIIPFARRKKLAVDYVTDFLSAIHQRKPESSNALRSGTILLLRLWQACGVIEEQGLPYQTLAAVRDSAPRFEDAVLKKLNVRPDGSDADIALLQAAVKVAQLTWIDTEVFGAINRSDSRRVIEVVDTRLPEVERTSECLLDANGRVQEAAREQATATAMVADAEAAKQLAPTKEADDLSVLVGPSRRQMIVPEPRHCSIQRSGRRPVV